MRLIPVATLEHVYFTVVDDYMYTALARFKWYALPDARTGKVYVVANLYPKQIRMSRIILGLTDPKMQADHVNGDTLDHRLCNLRAATHAQNQQNRPALSNNTSGYKGVYQGCYGWCARIAANGKRYYLGEFATSEEAARAYDDKARELHGRFARLNLP